MHSLWADNGRIADFIEPNGAAHAARLCSGIKMMKTRNIENRLALIGALIVLLGVSWAAGSAFAAETENATSAAVVERLLTDETIIGARKAIMEAAAEAAEALKAENEIDLDIQHADLTSLIAEG